MSLKEYNRKRKFNETPEPAGEVAAPVDGPLRYVIQAHDASKLHYDVRIELDGVFLSWAVPKGPSLNPNDQRLAVFVEDHPLAYGNFEGIIPKGNYGAGTVMLWDRGTFVERSAHDRATSEVNLRRAFAEGHITVVLSGIKLAGEFALIRLAKDLKGKSWLMLKKRDGFASYGAAVTLRDTSVATGRTMAEIAAQAPAKGEVWLPGKGPVDAAQLKSPDDNVEGGLLLPASPPTPRPRSRRSLGEGGPNPTETPDAARATEAVPRAMTPMLPTEASPESFSEGWFFSPRLPSHRALAEIDNQSVKLYSRQGLPYTKPFAAVAAALRAPKRQLLLDGELAVLGEHGRASKDLLRAYAKTGIGQPVYFVFDLLHMDGESWRDRPLAERRAALANLGITSDCVRLLPEAEDDPAAAMAAGAPLGAEGLLARHKDSAYRSGVSPYWLRLSAATAAAFATPASASSSPSSSPPGAPSQAAAPDATRVHLTHLDRVYFKADGITKGDLVAYYRDVAPVLLPYLRDRPESLNRHPGGIDSEGFFHKDMSGYLPPWAETTRVESGSSGRTIDYLVCQNEATLLYMANLGCIELNPWLSRVGTLTDLDYAVVDLDPDLQTFEEVITVALAVKDEVDRAGATSFIKTSGATGLHIYLPLEPGVSYERGRALAEAICRRVEARLPELTTTERTPSRRRRRLYLDYMQNRRGQTLASVYCVRPRAGAPVSAPLSWDEVHPGLHPSQFTLRTMAARLALVGDLWQGLSAAANDPEACLAALG